MYVCLCISAFLGAVRKRAGRIKSLCLDIETCIFPLIYNQLLAMKEEEIKCHVIEGIVSMSLIIKNLLPEVLAFVFSLDDLLAL